MSESRKLSTESGQLQFVLFTSDSQAEPQIVGHHIQSDAFLVQQ